MSQKKTFSKFNYYLMLFENYKDRLTLVFCLNLMISFIISHLSNFYKSIYFKNNLNTTFINATQFDISMFLEIVGYVYFASFFLHLVTYKANKYCIFLLNSSVLFFISNFLYFSFTINDILFALKKFHWPLIMCILGQTFLNCVWLNEIYQLFKTKNIRLTPRT